MAVILLNSGGTGVGGDAGRTPSVNGSGQTTSVSSGTGTTGLAPSPSHTTNRPVGGGAGGSGSVPSGDLAFSSIVECRYGQFNGADTSKNMLYVNFQATLAGKQPPASTTVKVALYYHAAWQEGFDATVGELEAGATMSTVGIADASTARTDSVELRLDTSNRLAEPNESNNRVTIQFAQPAGHATGSTWSDATPVSCHVA